MVLSRPEREAVNAAISERNDFFALLPPELTLAVFEYLNPLDVWRLRSVSKRWSTRLSDRQFIQSAVARWSDHDEIDRVSSGSARDLSQNVRHMQAFHSGRPFSRRTLRAGGLPIDLQLCGRYFVYPELDQRANGVLMVHDLLTNATTSYSGDGGRTPSCTVLTSTLVAFVGVSSGCLYWKRLDEDQSRMRSVRLPSANTLLAEGDADIIVLLVRANSIEQIIVFDASTSKLQCVDVSPGLDIEEPPHVPREWRMLVNARKGFVDIFGAALVTTAAPKCIHHFRVSLDGQRMEESAVLSRHPQLFTVKLLDRPLKTGHKGEYIMWIGPDDTEAAEYIAFDMNSGLCLGDPSFRSASCLRSGEVALWKGSLFSPTTIPPNGECPDGGRYFQGELHDEVGEVRGRYAALFQWTLRSWHANSHQVQARELTGGL